jgi:hypothetical protein
LPLRPRIIALGIFLSAFGSLPFIAIDAFFMPFFGFFTG